MEQPIHTKTFLEEGVEKVEIRIFQERIEIKQTILKERYEKKYTSFSLLYRRPVGEKTMTLYSNIENLEALQIWAFEEDDDGRDLYHSFKFIYNRASSSYTIELPVTAGCQASISMEGGERFVFCMKEVLYYILGYFLQNYIPSSKFSVHSIEWSSEKSELNILRKVLGIEFENDSYDCYFENRQENKPFPNIYPKPQRRIISGIETYIQKFRFQKIKEELYQKALHPLRIEKWVEADALEII